MGSTSTESLVYCKHQYSRQKIQGLPDLHQGDEHTDVHHLQNYLKHYGYLTHDSSVKNVLDEPTCEAMREFQKFFSIQQTGVLDQTTRDKMTASRCGVPDISLDPLAFSTTATGWNRRNLKYQFGQFSIQSPADAGVSKIRREAVRRAFDVWKNAGVGLTFEEISPESSTKADIFIEWRRAADPDHSMVGGVLAHADFPPGFSIIARELPLPLHFDDEEHQWDDGTFVGKYDVQTIAIHEIGHTLGMYHSNVGGSCMFPTVASNHSLRELQADDINGIKHIYPPSI